MIKHIEQTELGFWIINQTKPKPDKKAQARLNKFAKIRARIESSHNPYN